METAAIIIYFILTIFLGPVWPLALIGGKAGCLGRIIGLLWVGLLIAGLIS